MERTLIRTIEFKTLSNLSTFCKLASTLESDVNVKQRQYVVNGKSLMGLMSLNLLSPVVVEYETGSYEFDSFLNSLEIS